MCARSFFVICTIQEIQLCITYYSQIEVNNEKDRLIKLKIIAHKKRLINLKFIYICTIISDIYNQVNMKIK